MPGPGNLARANDVVDLGEDEPFVVALSLQTQCVRHLKCWKMPQMLWSVSPAHSLTHSLVSVESAKLSVDEANN